MHAFESHPEGLRPYGAGWGAAAWNCDRCNQGAGGPVWVTSVACSGLAHLNTAQNALDIGTPRALPVFAREGMRGLSFRGRTAP